MEKLKALLKKLGYTDDQVTTLLADEQKFDPTKMAEAARTTMREALENDEEFRNGLTEGVRSEVLASKENKLIKLGLITKEEYAALPKGKQFDEAIALIAKRKKEGGGTDEDFEEERQRLSQRIETLTTELETTKGSVDQQRSAFSVERDITRRLAKVKGLLIDVDDARELAMARLGERYDLTYDKGELVALQKGTKLRAVDKGNTEKVLSVDDLLNNLVTEKKWVQKSNGKPEGQETVRVRHGGEAREEGGRVMKNAPPGIAAAREEAERRSKEGRRGSRTERKERKEPATAE